MSFKPEVKELFPLIVKDALSFAHASASASISVAATTGFDENFCLKKFTSVSYEFIFVYRTTLITFEK